MFIEKIHLENFRNYKGLTIDFDKRNNILIGINGSGKTNLLESIYYLSTTKSFRGSSDRDITRWGCQFFLVEGYVKGESGEEVIKIIYKEKKSVFINNIQEKRIMDIIGHLFVVPMLIEDLNMVSGPPYYRRSFMDVILSMTDRIYLDNLKRYNMLIRQKNAILKKREKRPDLNLIYTLNDGIVKYGSYIVAKRIKLIDFFNAVIKELLNEVYLRNIEFTVKYKSNIGVEAEESDVGEIGEIMYRKLDNEIEREKLMGVSMFGPHRDDILIYKDNYGVRKFGSTGEARLSAIIMRLCQLKYYVRERSITPVIIIDDVFNELDGFIKDFTWKMLNIGAQTIVATTDESNLPESMNIDKKYKVDRGKIIINEG